MEKVGKEWMVGRMRRVWSGNKLERALGSVETERRRQLDQKGTETVSRKHTRNQRSIGR